MTKRFAAGLLLLWTGLPAPSQGQALPATLELDRAIEIALSRHGQLDASQAAIEARAGARKQAGLSPNPVFSLQTENWRFYGDPGFSASRDLDVFAVVSLPLETGHKKHRRIELAEVDQRVAELERQGVAWRVRQTVKRAYWQALGAQARLEMLAGSRETLRQLEQYHEVRVRLGAIAEVDLIKVRVESSRIALAVAAAEMQMSQAKIAVLEAMGVSGAGTAFELRQPDAKAANVSWEGAQASGDFIETAIAHRAEILLGQAHVERARAAVDLQQSLGRPDVTPYLGYKRTDTFHTLVGGFSIPLPVRNKNTGAIEEALAEVRRQEAMLRALETRIRAEAAGAVDAVRRRSEMLRSMESGMLERAGETARIATAAYQEGGAELLDVLDAQRAQNDIRLLYSQMFFDYQLSWVELETTAGTSSLPQLAGGAQTAADWSRMQVGQ
jgi:cobalt-zinc-cadmium efflux system outer membrane protein